MKKSNPLINQEAFGSDFFPALSEWPEGYKEGLLGLPLGKGIFGFDIETKGLNPYDTRVMILSVGLSDKDKEAYGSYCRNGWKAIDLEILRLVLESPHYLLIGQNIKYDINWIAVKTGIVVKAMLFDIQFAQYLLDENDKTNSLEGNIARAFKENKKDFADLSEYKSLVNRDDLDRQHKDDLLIYNCRDADASRRLYNYYVPKLKADGYDKLMVTSSMVLPVLSKIETKGVYLDKEWAYKTQSKIFNDLVKLRYEMCDIAKTSFNPDSSQQLAKILYGRLRFTQTNTTDSGAPSTSAQSISYLLDQANTEDQDKFLNAIVKYKKQMKLLTTYYQPIERWTKYDGRVHCNYSLGRFENEEGQGGTVTGRLSCREPNLQNIPRGKQHRGMFAATKGYSLLDGDFSQLELRVAAYLSQEPAMMDAFLNNLDIHTSVMSGLTGIPYNALESELKGGNAKLKNDRVAFKEVNFGIFYGMSAKRLQNTLFLKAHIKKSIPECQKYIDDWFAKYNKAKEWLDNTKLFAVAHKFVRMPLGQKRRLPDADFSWEGGSALRQATNFPVQSMASWICLIGLKLLDDYFVNNKIDGHIIMQVHDSVTCEISQSNLISLEDIKVDVKKVMEQETLNYIKDVFGVNFNVPLSFDIDFKERWS